jgi:hypothetical protein
MAPPRYSFRQDESRGVPVAAALYQISRDAAPGEAS